MKAKRKVKIEIELDDYELRQYQDALRLAKLQLSYIDVQARQCTKTFA